MCGVFALIARENNPAYLKVMIEGLKLLQHRGKDGFGIVSSTKTGYDSMKLPGMITEKADEITNGLQHNGAMYVGHNRYSTSGKYLGKKNIDLCELQPLEGDFNGEPFWLVHNGNIPGLRQHDTTFILNSISEHPSGNMESSLIALMESVSAAYCLVVLYRDSLYAMRDRYGIRPLCVGANESITCISSESRGLGEIPMVRNVAPGEIVRISACDMTTIYTHPETSLSLCTFEILYFSHEDSMLDGYSVKDTRMKLARTLASIDKCTLKGTPIVVGIPETGVILGQSYARELGLEYEQLITKNPSSSRTFIVKTKEDREKACLEKFLYSEKHLHGRDTIIVDDTIVRGTVITSIIKRLKSIGVGEIHVRIPAPPVTDVCHLGISIQSKDELVKTGRTVEEIRSHIGATSLRYLELSDLDGLVPKKSYNHCFSGWIDPKIMKTTSISNDCHSQDTLQT